MGGIALPVSRVGPVSRGQSCGWGAGEQHRYTCLGSVWHVHSGLSPLAFQVLQGHDQASTMVALMRLYAEEEEAYQALVTATTAYFQNLLQPFRDMREVATSCKLAILVCSLCIFIGSDLLSVPSSLLSLPP